MTRPDLIGSAEAATIAGVTPSTFRTLVASTTPKDPVPPPIVRGSQGHRTLWDRAAIEAWAAQRDRRRGRAPAPEPPASTR